MDAPKFLASVRTVRPALRGYAYRLTRDATASDDLVQDALVRAWAARGQFAPGTNFKAWIFRIARNCFLTNARRAWRNAGWDDGRDEPLLVQAPRQEDTLYARDLERLLDAVSSEQRQALALIVQEGLSYEQASTALGVAIGTLKSRVGRARAIIAIHLADNSTFGAIEDAGTQVLPPRVSTNDVYRRWKASGGGLIG